MTKRTIRELKDDSYKKWTFLRDISFTTCSYDKQKKIQNYEIKEYEKYHFFKKLGEVIDKNNSEVE
jgi:hypothetical protein